MIGSKAIKRRLERLTAQQASHRNIVNVNDLIEQLQNGVLVDWDQYLITSKLRSIIEQLADQEGGELD